jgi:4-carboxymuconolactone decarboxylase
MLGYFPKRENIMRLNVIIAGALGALMGAAAISVAAPELNLRGDRFRPLSYDELTPAQKVLADRELAAPSRSGGGPLNIYLRSPDYAEVARPLSTYLRFKAPFPEKLKELTIMLTARFWGGTYVWYSHRPFALKEGLSEAFITAMAAGQRPAGMAADETIVHDFVTELLATKTVSDAHYKAFVDRFGERAVVDLVGLMGAYHTTSMLFAVERYPLPAGAKEEIARPM